MTRGNGGINRGLNIRANWKQESGQTLILLALSLVVLCGFLGLAIDVGQARATQRKLQEAADAAALAGALEVNQCSGISNCSVMQTAAQAALTENGLTGSTLQTQICSVGSSTSLTLTLNNGPCALGSSDPNYNNTQYVEAVVSEPQPTAFARILGIKSFNVSVRSESMGSPNGCLYTIGKPGQGSLTIDHGAHIDATNCAIIDDGDLNTAGGAHEDSTLFQYGGTYNGGGGLLNPEPTHGPQVPDPVNTANFPAPPTGTCTALSPFSGTSSLDSGHYCGITVNNGGRLTLTGGTYYLSGNFVANSGSRVDGTAGATLVFLSGSYVGNSGSRVDLNAPTTGDYPGFAVYQIASDTTPFNFDPGNASTWEGIVYVPGAELDINDGGSTTDNVLIVAYSAVVNPGGKLTVTQNWSWMPNGSPLKYPSVLAE